LFYHPTPAPPLGDGRGVKLVASPVRRSPPFSGEGSEVSGFPRQVFPSLLRGGAGVGSPCFVYPLSFGWIYTPSVRRSLPMGEG